MQEIRIKVDTNEKVVTLIEDYKGILLRIKTI